MQLFTHLLSSYLQGMGDFFSALPKGGSSFLQCLRWLCGVPSPWGRLGWGLLVLLPLGEGWDGALDGALDGASMPMPWCRCR